MNPSEPAPQDYNPQDDAVRQFELPERTVGLQRGSDVSVSDLREPPENGTARLKRGWLLRGLAVALPVLVMLAAVGFLGGQYWLQRALRQSLPIVDGRMAVPGLAGPVTVLRDEHGVPHLRASSMDDLVFAQGYVTAEDRLWQMDALRRHAAGELAAILGKSMIEHDRAQRNLQIRAAADRALMVLPADERHWLDVYASGVNAAVEAMEAAGGHLPLEFRLLHYQPAPWTARDSLLVGLAMSQDLSTSYPEKLDREALSSRLAPELMAELYPVGSWRDHPPTQPMVDLTTPREMLEIPLDESQTGSLGRERREVKPVEAAVQEAGLSKFQRVQTGQNDLLSAERVDGLLEARQSLALMTARWLCAGCMAGSNGWAVAGSRTRSGKPMLSSDMHLRHGIPGIWYEADLEAPTAGGGQFHVAGVTLPGTPFVIVGHNQHIAWSFTNLYADVQDLYIEQTRGAGSEKEFQGSDGAWHPVLHRREVIEVRGGADLALDVAETEHGGVETPILSGPTAVYPKEKRTIALRWTIYDPSAVRAPFYAVNAATDWQSLLQAIAGFAGPAQNMMYADDQGHIGYHATGRIPLRGAAAAESLAAAQAAVAAATNTAAPGAGSQAQVPGPLQAMVPVVKPVWTALSPVPTDGRDPRQEWAGYIPFDQLPEAFDPPNGVVETANARITPDDYPYPVTLDWSDPYRQERIWKVLNAKQDMVPADMLTLQTDVYSELDRVVAERLAYAIDHAAMAGHTTDTNAGAHLSNQAKRLRQAADLMRGWDGTVAADAAAPAIVDAARAALWPLLLEPKLGAQTSTAMTLYNWGEKGYAEEQIIVNQPVHWLPARYPNWNELLAAAVESGLEQSDAPQDLSRWRYGQSHPVEIEHPIYSRSPLLERMLGVRTGTGALPQSGDGSTVKQVARTFGPSERMTVDFGNLDGSMLNVVLGESMDPASPWYMDQWPAWYSGTTFAMPFSDAAAERAAKHSLTLVPR
ncbi:MAG TPA: penicillin acylase family protein [Granulicella sp.]|nr:penicillin acylase family protein [Granulicella sp.]